MPPRFLTTVIEAAAMAAGYQLLVSSAHETGVREVDIARTFRQRRVDGIILASMYTRELVPPEGLLDGPAVLLNALPAGLSAIPSVVPDEAEAGRTAARVLLDAGHREGICLIGAEPGGVKTPRDSVAAVERLQGILTELQGAGVQIAGAVGCRDWQPGQGFEATRQLLARNPRPSAVICFNDRLALGSYQALADAGLEVPADVSVISFDDDVFASWIRPQLTTVALPHYELGRAAVRLLLGQISGSGQRQPGIQRVPMPLRERSSVRRFTHPQATEQTSITA